MSVCVDRRKSVRPISADCQHIATTRGAADNDVMGTALNRTKDFNCWAKPGEMTKELRSLTIGIGIERLFPLINRKRRQRKSMIWVSRFPDYRWMNPSRQSTQPCPHQSDPVHSVTIVPPLVTKLLNAALALNVPFRRTRKTVLRPARFPALASLTEDPRYEDV